MSAATAFHVFMKLTFAAWQSLIAKLKIGLIELMAFVFLSSRVMLIAEQRLSLNSFCFLSR